MVDKLYLNVYYEIMENELAAKRLAELKVGDEGAPVGQIQNQLGVPNSTLSHHINRLVSVGLIRQIRESRTLYCVPQFEVLQELIDFLQAECCTEGKCNTSDTA
jgi:DNA-binding transcriptional ArsR family regulator